MRLGLRLRWLCDGTDRLNWSDLISVVENSPTDSAVVRNLQGGIPGWGLNEWLLADVVDALNAIACGLSHGRMEQPDRVWRPVINHQEDNAPNTQGGFGGVFGDEFEEEPMTIEEANSFLGL